MFYNILSEILLFMSGEISDKLFKGAKHFYHVYTRTVNRNTTISDYKRILQKSGIIRSYIFLFSRLFKKLITVINKRWNVNLEGNMYVINTNKNLEKIVELTMLPKRRKNVLRSVEVIANKLRDEYGKLNVEYINHGSMKSENDYFATPVIDLGNIIKLLEDNVI